MKAPSSGISLTEADAAVVKGMLARGDRQHDVAAWFGVNGGRIAEIASGTKFANVAAQHADLPPPGPYISGRTSIATRDKLLDVRARLYVLIQEIDDLLENI